MKNSGIWKKQNCLYEFIFLNMMVNKNNTKSQKNIDYITIADQSRTVRFGQNGVKVPNIFNKH